MPERTATTLDIRHLEGSDPACFVVSLLDDGKGEAPSVVPSPWQYLVRNRPKSNLMAELRWYLEEFLVYPFPPQTDHAERVLDAVRGWGEGAFEALFKGHERLFDSLSEDGYANLHLRIVADDPAVLSWPWEGLRDPQAGYLAQACSIERRMRRVVQPVPELKDLPRDRLNILMVTARPFSGDISHRSVSRPLLESFQESGLNARIDVLRPPTFRQLETRLQEKPGHYHVLHFDGHGGYSVPEGWEEPLGAIVFEDEQGRASYIYPERFAELMHQHGVALVVLNACRSAMHEQGADPFASVASALAAHGVRGVLAMSHNVMVSAVPHCLTAFYRRLIEEGSAAEAARAGRQEMLAHPQRVCARGTFPLRDWLVPVLYQREPLDFSFFAKSLPKEESSPSRLPDDVLREREPHGFVGRDGALLEMERALRGARPAILIHGLGGIGKTTLARGFLRWMESTDGLSDVCFWLRFNDIRSAEYVLHAMGVPLLGEAFIPLRMEEKIVRLAQELRRRSCLIVWDNFESARGIPGSPIEGNLTSEDRALLVRLLEQMRGSASKVLITSRSREDWLGEDLLLPLSLGGLDAREERWEYCQRVLDDLCLKVDRDDPVLVELMNLLGGHPLCMRVTLSRLASSGMTARHLVEQVRGEFADFEVEDPLQAQLFATLRLAEDALPDDLQPLLPLLILHEGYVDSHLFLEMAQQVDAGWTRPRINAFLDALSASGLLWSVGEGTYEMHPSAPGGFPCTWRVESTTQPETWIRAFVDIMGTFADQVAPLPEHLQRWHFFFHDANFHQALAGAEQLGMHDHFGALIQALALHAENTRHFESASRRYMRYAEHAASRQDHERAASAYHLLGVVAEQKRDLAEARRWFQKSLALSESLGDQPAIADSCHQLGRIWEEERDFAQARRWYQRSLDIEERLGDQQDAALTHHQLGIVAQEEGDFLEARKWYDKSLEVEERFGSRQGVATSYFQLGRLAEEQRDVSEARRWYRKALQIECEFDNQEGVAHIYHQLGNVSAEEDNLIEARRWYLKSLDIKDRLGDQYGAAFSYYQLGRIAEKEGDSAEARRWYLKTLEIDEWLRNQHCCALTYGQLGILSGWEGRFEEAAELLCRCVRMLLEVNDSVRAERSAGDFLVFWGQAPPQQQAKMRAMWEEAGLEPLDWDGVEDTEEG